MVRTRIAPSPTGHLHIGTARTALFNYLFAKHAGGQFVLRIEDTDLERSRKEYEDDILEGLRWLGIHWDEGPDNGGAYGPYRQRERLDLYKKYLQQLSDKDLIYRCYCAKEELEHEREIQILSKQPPKYSGKCRKLTAAERDEREKRGDSSTIRFKVTPKVLKVADLIRGELIFDTGLMDDFIIAKDFDTPLYNFAVVVDDYAMKISHVIRGEDHISNTPKQLLIDEALGFDPPIFAHLSLILNPDRTKLSKRQNKVSLLEYREDGFLPQATVNFISLLGWNPGGEQEIFSLDELTRLFDIAKVNKAGAVFNIQKLEWFNNHYLRTADLASITEQTIPYFIKNDILEETNKSGEYMNIETGEHVSRATLERIVALERDRVKKLSEIAPDTRYFFEKHLEYDLKLLQWKTMTQEKAKEGLGFAHKILSDVDAEAFTAAELETLMKTAIKDAGTDNGSILWPLRVALTGLERSPNPFEIAAILGKEKTLARITAAYQKLP